MAELHVQTKKNNSSAWIWILVALLIIGAVAYYLLQDRKETNNKQIAPNSTSYDQPVSTPHADTYVIKIV